MLYQLSYMGEINRKLKFTMLERVMGIEPTSSAWKAEVLPLNYTRHDPLYARDHRLIMDDQGSPRVRILAC